MTKDEALKKIKQCLALAESDNIHEAQSALLMAQKLMIKYRITEDEATKEEDIEKLVKTISIISNKARLMWYETSLASIIADNFKVVSYSSGSRERGKNLNYMGLEEDVEIAQEVFAFALERMKKIANKKVKDIESKDNKYKSSFRNDFYRGFIDGLDKAFKEQVEKNSWGLILVVDAVVLKEVNKLNLKKVKKTGIPPKFSNDKKLYNEGYKDGKNFGDSFNSGNSLDTKLNN